VLTYRAAKAEQLQQRNLIATPAVPKVAHCAGRRHTTQFPGRVGRDEKRPVLCLRVVGLVNALSHATPNDSLNDSQESAPAHWRPDEPYREV